MSDNKVAIKGAPTYSVRELTKPYLTESASAGGDWGPIDTGTTTANQLCYKTDWGIPVDFTSESWARRCEYLIVMWYLKVSVDRVGSKTDPVETTIPLSVLSSDPGRIHPHHTFLLSRYSHKTDFIVIPLANYYPNQCPADKNPLNKNWKSYVTIKSLTCKVFAVNSLDYDFYNYRFKNRPSKYKNDVEYLESCFKCTSTTTTFYQPKNPSIDPIQLENGNGTIVAMVYRPQVETNYPTTRGKWWITKKDNFTNTYKTEKAIVRSGETDSEHVFSGDSAVVEYDVPDANALQIGQWMHFRVYGSGLGPSGICKGLSLANKVYKSYIFAYPAQAKIVSAEPSSTATSTSSSGGSQTYVPGGARIYFKIQTNNSTYRPVDSVVLQRLANTTANTASKAQLAQGWEDIIEDDGQCTGLVDVDVAGATPELGNYTWYRLKTVHGPYVVYSGAYYAKFLYRSRPTASDDTVQIVDVFPTTDAKHLIVYLTWPNDDATGNEISWTDDNRKWYSTEDVQTWQKQWKESAATVQKLRTKYGSTLIPANNNVMSFYISNVEPGTGYYIRARRYLTDDTRTTYGKWNYFRNSDGSLMKICCTKKPTNVKLNASNYAIKGDPLPLTWTADIDAPIKYWQIVGIKSKTVNGVQTDKETVLATGNSNLTYTTLDADTLKKFIGNDATIYLGCRIHTGGTMSNLAKKTIKIVSRPTLTLKANVSIKDNVNYLRSQPLKVQFKTNDTGATIIVKVVAKGITTEFPTGTYVQENGEVIWSGSGKASSANEWNTITLPSGIKFIDGGQYTLEVVAFNKTNGLSSDTRSIDFTCNWSSKVEPPSKKTYITSTVIGPDTLNRIYAQINWAEPNTRPESDRFDIYRVTPDGITLYAKGCLGKSSIVDWWAPYSNTGYLSIQNNRHQIKDPTQATAKLMYRIVARSTNGDMQWIDVPYTIRVPYVRIDWRDPGKSWKEQNDTFVTFPYNLVMSDSYEKDFELRRHLDGRTEGYWNPGVKRTRTISTDVIRLANADQIAKMREMAQHAGPMFVRMPDGCAFEADVQVNQIENHYNDPVLAVSLSITQIDLTKDFGHPTNWAQQV